MRQLFAAQLEHACKYTLIGRERCAHDETKGRKKHLEKREQARLSKYLHYREREKGIR